jgi:hypothetical protein
MALQANSTKVITRTSKMESSPKCSVDSHSSGLLVLVLVG